MNDIEVAIMHGRVGSANPVEYRLAKRAGQLVLQGGYEWRDSQSYGIEWRDMPTVDLDAAGEVTPSSESQYPATRTVHCMTGDVDCCDKHAVALTGLMRFLGTHVVDTPAQAGAQCSNCVNEASKNEVTP